VQSNCLSVIPLETEFGRKRAIDQSSCNKDFSCLNGFCPSLVTVEGGQPRAGRAIDADESAFAELPVPPLADTRKPFNILLTGVGGTGVVTLGALLGMAAHLDGKGVSVLDMTGLAQKFGAVFAHLRIADRPQDIHAARIATGEADVVIGGDLVVAASAEALSKVLAGKTRAVVNVAETPTAEFTRNPDWQFPQAQLRALLDDACGPGQTLFLDAAELARRLMGDTIYGNLFLLGVAWQRGLVPVSLAALEQAIELNGTAVERNRKAFLWGRRTAHDGDAVRRLSETATATKSSKGERFSRSLEEIIARRREDLTAYQNVRYAERYGALVSRVQNFESALGRPSTALSEAVARNYYKLLAYKDEYEVARLHSDPAFGEQLRAQFEGNFSLRFHLAPPLFARPDLHTGRIEKHAYGAWMLHAFNLLRRLKFLRGTIFDPFAHSAERRLDRQLLANYEADVELILRRLASGDEETLNTALELASLPEQIRGFAHIRAAAAERAGEQRAALRRLLAATATT
jgi:indolepyruvate ferredoxin oxidoreductase